MLYKCGLPVSVAEMASSEGNASGPTGVADEASVKGCSLS